MTEFATVRPTTSAQRVAPAPRLTYLTGFEGTQIFGSGVDVLDTSEHAIRYPQDLQRLASDGIGSFRCCIPWHKIERVRGQYDWGWTDRYLAQVRRLGLNPIVDPLHHTSFPQWLEHGFANPAFPALYTAFLQAFARRYPWVTDYTVINEPFATAILSGFLGAWYPHWQGREGVVRIILGKVRAIHRATAMLADCVPGLRIVHVDTCEYHHALDRVSQNHADFSNDMRFVVLDLLLGRMDRAHPLYGLFMRYGLTEDDLARLRDAPAQIDVLGLDYYAHSELGWTSTGQSDAFHPLGFRAVALDYAARYPFDLMLSETNVRGRIEDRLTWLKYMVGESEALATTLAGHGRRFAGFCWYPYIDSTDWCSLCRAPDRRIDPQGIYYLCNRFDRQPSELSEVYASLVAGRISAADIPAYRMEDAVLTRRRVGKYLIHMTGFDWKDGDVSALGAVDAQSLPMAI
jgi:beta-glucosidase/6-phospho-beta-glucosidase/beta-galactosidase